MGQIDVVSHNHCMYKGRGGLGTNDWIVVGDNSTRVEEELIRDIEANGGWSLVQQLQ